MSFLLFQSCVVIQKIPTWGFGLKLICLSPSDDTLCIVISQIQFCKNCLIIMSIDGKGGKRTKPREASKVRKREKKCNKFPIEMHHETEKNYKGAISRLDEKD